MRGLSLGALAVVCVSVSVGLAQAAGQDSRPRFARHPAPQVSADGSAFYIVRLKDAPAATYTGGVPGYAATSPRLRGETTLDVEAAASYAAYLDERQSALLDTGAKLLGRELQARYRYHYALNGMSVRLTPAEALQLASLPGVLSVQPVRYFSPDVNIPAGAADTNASRVWINAPMVWLVPSHSGTDNEGEGTVLADLDTGINDANSSFAATDALDGYVAEDTGGLRFGVCDPGNTKQHAYSTPLVCNDKLIGAYSYTHGANDPNSPEDSEGHGSHTASTVAGDFITTTINGVSTALSGVAPHASIIAYDVCDPTDECAEDDSVAAVEQAIKDQTKLKKSWGSAFKGMVLNFSIGGTENPYDDTVEQAFLSAVEAGIYVSAAGGNGGPSNAILADPKNSPQYAVQHMGPWVATITAATHDGVFSSNKLESFTGGDATTLPHTAMAGQGDTAGFGPQPLVYSGDFAAPPVKSTSQKAPTSGENYPASLGSTEDARQCLYPYPAATFTATEIVVCDRGTIPLVDKAYNVQHGGAMGMVIATTATSSQDLVVEPYVIPATLLGLTNGNRLRNWIAASSGSLTPASADISGSILTIDKSRADQIAGFSSRGPVNSEFDSVIKPDMAAPGVSVLAAVNDPGFADGCSSCSSTQPDSFDFFDGTSMATPHDTGAAALLMQAHPKWTVSEVKSALMLTAVTANDGNSPGVSDQCAKLDSGKNCVASKVLPSPHVRGAGRIDVDAAERSGLVLDETGAHYVAADPAKGGDLTSLNLASLANANCSGTCSWTRIVKSTFSSASVTYHVSTSGISSGLQLSISPTSFTLAPSQTQVITVKADVSKLAGSTWVFGTLNLTTSDSGDGGAVIPDMHMPVAVQTVVVSSGSGSGTGSGKSGGGGDMGLFGLATLLLALRRKSRRD
jgi:subtilisin family serine protease